MLEVEEDWFSCPGLPVDETATFYACKGVNPVFTCWKGYTFMEVVHTWKVWNEGHKQLHCGGS